MTAGGRAAATAAARRRPSSAIIGALAAVVAIEALVGAAAVVARLTTKPSAAAETAEAFPGPERNRILSDSTPGPIEVAIPRIGVRSGLVGLGLNGDGSLETPNEYDAAGWWTAGSSPGANGPAVIVGHRDSHTGPAVFYRLGRLEPGDEVSVRRSDGSLVRFLVEERLQFSKGEFPTERVYAPTEGPSLRLITCGGRFDRRKGEWDANVVVFARLAPEGEAGSPQ